MAVTLTPIVNVVLRVPETINGASLVLEPGLTTFINTAKPLTVDGIVRVREAHTNDWLTQWDELEFISTSANATSLEAAANTLQASLNTQNGVNNLIVDAVAIQGNRVQFS